VLNVDMTDDIQHYMPHPHRCYIGIKGWWCERGDIMLKNILIPLDGSQLAETAVRYAKEILAEDGKLTLLSVVQPPEVPMYDFYPTPAPRMRSFEDEMKDAVKYAQDYLEKLADELRSDLGVTVITRIENGDPALEIVAAAEESKSDAIVMSTHGRSGLSRWIFGSVTQKVLAAAPCPILVIPGKVATEGSSTARTSVSA
jgi:nucleotide-binding universal stress UspA family protein